MAMTEEELLHHLQDIVEPAAPGWWPPAVGWWLLALLILTALLALVFWLVRRHRVNRFRRDGEAALQQIAAQHARTGNHQQLLESLNALLKQIAITRYGRNAAAHLHGQEWCEFLSSKAKGVDFRSPPGSLLGANLYRPHSQVPAAELEALTRRWIRGCR